MKLNLIIFIIAVALLPFTNAINCATASSSICGVDGLECKYYVWSNGTCLPPASCIDTSTIWVNTTNNCQECGSLGQTDCPRCSSVGYYYDTGVNKCLKCSALFGQYCTTCTNQVCLSCSNSLTLAQDSLSCVDGTCGISFCSLCQNSTACQTCDSLHTIFMGICVCFIPNCKYCKIGSSQLCSLCMTGYQLSPDMSTCAPICIESCKTCLDTTTCSNCLPNYYYNSDSHKCVLNCTLIDVTHCLTCSSKTICQQCQSSYTLNQYGTKCELKCDDVNCMTCSTPSVCTQCSTGYILNVTFCQQDVCVIQNCFECSGSQSCKTCNQFYELTNSNTTCNPICYLADQYCVECLNGTSCKTCQSGYSPVSGICTPICQISHCFLCKSQVYCQQCNDGYAVSASQTTCDYDCQIPNCMICNSTTSCQTCQTGHTLSGLNCLIDCGIQQYLSVTNNTSVCKGCPQNCIYCEAVSSGVMCNECDNLYYVNSSFLCQPCTFIDPNCFSCQQKSAICLSCATGYVLSNSITCVKKSSIVCTLAHCYTCSPTNTAICAECNQGYVLGLNGTCSQFSCSNGQFLSDSVCTCGAMAYYNNNECKPCKSNCLSCTSSACSLCLDGYYPKQKKCISCDDHCATCTALACITCEAGYSMNSNKVCKKQQCGVPVTTINGKPTICPAGCNACNENSQGSITCSAAQDGFVILQGIIYRCDSNCATCSNKFNSTSNTFSQCLSCYNGYSFYAGICTTCLGSFALTCSKTDATYSLTCKSGYTAESGVCKACSDNCRKCNNRGPGSCDDSGCQTGFIQIYGGYLCVNCFLGCVVCDNTNPNKCISCGYYKYPSADGSTCHSCSNNCKTCTSSTTCTNCDAGYLITTSGTCVIPPGPPCISYNSDIVCTVCDNGFELVNGACTTNLACNTGNTCVACPFNYYLSTKRCLKCPTISNCLSCAQQSSSKCMSCAIGYYLTSSYTCTKCKTGCLQCTSQNICTLASAGYYITTTQTGVKTGKIQQCDFPCSECYNDDTFCTSCPTDYTLSGRQCIYNFNYYLTIVGILKSYEGQTGDFQLGKMWLILPVFLKQLYISLGFTSFRDFNKFVQMKSGKSGSAIFNLQVSGNSVSQDPTNIISNTVYSPFKTLTSSSVVNSIAAIDSKPQMSLGLILGVSIPLGLLLITIVVIIKVRYNKTDEEDLDVSDKQFATDEM